MKAPITPAQAWAVIAESDGWNEKERDGMTTPNEELIAALKVIARKGVADYFNSANPNSEQIAKAADALQSQAERIATLHSLLVERTTERDTLRAQLDAITASHAGVKRYCGDVQKTGTLNGRAIAQTVSRMLARPPRPMPADVTGLVELMRYMRAVASFERNDEIDAALSKYKGAK